MLLIVTLIAGKCDFESQNFAIICSLFFRPLQCRNLFNKINEFPIGPYISANLLSNCCFVVAVRFVCVCVCVAFNPT